jgi:hypothetical protein
MSTTVLHVLGLLGYEPAERLLWNYVVGVGDHYEMMDACFGLVHLPCTGIREEIERQLRKNVRNALFPEFLPILATKLDDPSWVGRLAAWGEGPASTDCNGGLILGLALLGGRDEFIRALWNPRWEAYSFSTGTSRFAYLGTRVLDLGIRELYTDLRTLLASDPGERKAKNAIRTFVSMLEHWLGRPWLGLRGVPEPTETCLELCTALLTWSTPDKNDSLTGLSSEEGISRELYQLERDLQRAASHEVELQYFGRQA